jgi:AraC-like DNA-binding protein
LNIEQKLELFRDLVSCNYSLHYWKFDSELNILYSNCPNEILFNEIFSLSGCKDYMLSYGQNSSTPLVLSDNLGLVWTAVYEKEHDSLIRIHLLGPAFTSETSHNNIEKALQNYQLSMAVKYDMLQQLKQLPFIAITSYLQYALMLHFCVNEKKLNISDIEYQIHTSKPSEGKQQADSRNHSSGVWMIEQTLLKLVEDGNLDYKDALKNAVNISYGVKISIGDPIRQAKDSVIIFTALCTRAAIKGGLSPATAYSVGDYYTQNVENCSTISEVASTSHTMYDDFIHRVHKQKNTNSGISKPIQSCCDYIQMHLCDKLPIQELSSRVGYTDYYLTRKFKKEVGCSINDYIKNAKIEHAKLLLSSTTQSIQDISDSLNFCSRSYFTDTFQKVAGVSPSDYREKNLKI